MAAAHVAAMAAGAVPAVQRWRAAHGKVQQGRIRHGLVRVGADQGGFNIAHVQMPAQSDHEARDNDHDRYADPDS